MERLAFLHFTYWTSSSFHENVDCGSFTATIKHNLSKLKVIKVPESPHYFLQLEIETWNVAPQWVAKYQQLFLFTDIWLVSWKHIKIFQEIQGRGINVICSWFFLPGIELISYLLMLWTWFWNEVLSSSSLTLRICRSSSSDRKMQ